MRKVKKQTSSSSNTNIGARQTTETGIFQSQLEQM